MTADEIDDSMVEAKLDGVKIILGFDDPLQRRAELYGLAAFRYEDLYLGFLWVFYASGSPGGRDVWPYAQAGFGTIDTQLVSSRDLLHWNRVGNREPIVPRGEPGEWDGGMILAYGNPIIMGDEIWIYYRGINDTHGSGFKAISACGLAKLRLDGFVSIDAGKTEGSILTKPFTCTDENLIVNADANGGSLVVEILDADGKPISGFGKEECEALSDDNIRHPVKWKERQNLTGLQGSVIQLKFHLTKAKIFSFVIQ